MASHPLLPPDVLSLFIVDGKLTAPGAGVLIFAGLAVFKLFTVVVAWAYRWTRVGLGCRRVPSAPGGNWLLGNLLQLAPPVCAWEKMYDWLADASILRFRMFHRTGILVGDAEGLKRVFQTRQKVYEKDTEFAYEPFLPILGTGLVTAPNGPHWQEQRLLMAPALRIDMLDSIIPIAKRGIERLCGKLEAFRGTNQPVEMEEEFRLLTLQIIGEAILSLPPEECDRVFPALYLPVMNESNARVLQPWRRLYPLAAWRYNSRVRQLNDYIVALLRQRRDQHLEGTRSAKGGDILDRIIAAVLEGDGPWGVEVETQLCYEVKTFLLAGHETSAAMLCWSVYELSQDPKALAAVRKEADAVFGSRDKGAVPSREKVDGMEYTLSTLKEALRKYSVVPVVCRTLLAPDRLLGQDLPAGAWIVCHLQRVHHRYKQPLAFRPDRFMPGGEYDQFPEDIRPYMFVPFIQGPRNCLGQYFALLEARVLLSVLCQRFTLTPVDSTKQGVTHPSVIPIGPLHKMPMYIS